MLRLLGFFVLAYLLVSLLAGVPGIGWLFRGFFGFWLAAILLGVALTRLSELGVRRARMGSRMRELEAVDSPHNQGKLGSLLLGGGSAARAVPHLERAVEGEPESAEWRYRLGQALLRTGQGARAVEVLQAAAAIDEEHAYGGVQLALAEARLRNGDAAGALAALDTFDRNHGPSPESAYRRGIALRKLGRRDEAAASLRKVGELASRAAKFKQQENRGWVLRAFFARIA